MARGLLIHPRLNASVQAVYAGVLLQTYTRTPQTPDPNTQDAWGDAPNVPGDAVTGQPCQYIAAPRFEQGPEGRVLVNTPELRVPASDPLKPGDLVSAITAQDGTTVLLAGPATVETVRSLAAAGPVLLKRCTLRAAGAV